MKRLQGVCFALCFGYVQNTVALFCPSGQFALKHQCVGCHPTCWECNGHELFECTKCGVDEDGQERFFHQGRCRLHCPRGFYPEQDLFTCEPCMVNCELCADAKVCAKCTGNYKLQSGVCHTTECKEGQVEDPETGECIDCETGCETCSADDPELCKSCMEGYFLYRYQCRRGCPQKTYRDEGKKMCFACPTPCIDCRSDSLCLSCQAGHYLSDGSCVKQCPDGTYGEPSSWRCESCHGSCQTCHGSLPRNCESCPHGNLPMYGQCPTTSCVEGQYMDAADNKCYSCDVSCKTCFGPQALDCSSCCTGYFLDQEGACVEYCPMGYFINPATQLCEECSANCESCEGGAEKCLRCKKGQFLHQGNCWSNCPEGYFESAEGTCEACDSLCLSCDENKSNCMSCAVGLYLENGSCSPNCSVKYYPDVDRTCRHCSAHCDTCTDGKTCKACSYLYLLLDGMCKATCPKGYFEDLDQGKCIPCHSTCASCSGTQHDDCDSCSSQSPRLYEGQCSVECPAGTYYESSANECQECDRTCSSCTGPELTDCTKCKKGLALNPDTMMCGVTGDSNCPPKTFLHDNQFTCVACHKQCESCNGPNANDCQTCTLPNYLYNGTCLTVCPAGTFESSEEADGVGLGFCSACDHVCATCTGASPKDCITCSSGYFRFMHLCILHCPAGYYRGTTHCDKCDPSCRLCSGPGPQACLSCPPHMLQLEGTRQCVEHCPERFYQENYKCKQCHTSCKTCKDYTPQGCLTCDWGSTLQNGICYPRCEEQRYLSEDEVCKLCDSSCRHCSGLGPNQCVSCKLNFALHPTEKRCIECCEGNQTDCCLCSTNSALCIERPNPELERRLMSENMNSLVISHVSATVPALVMLVLVITLAVFGLYQARARKKLCWKLSYERLSGSADPSASYRRDMLHGVPDPDDSADESDVVYTSSDGTVYHRYNFIKAQDEEAEEHEHQTAYLNKARC
ncbi:proprotein convertase subtilisin/kexin type 5-like [Polyodon spathula]|uniref:proprotein convertase subtilisin/kexin type 5-like n=1 Tax=Polyodon spathula TaxID=7913 RepID=UPI001B7EC734|nr:proprotein convertase subtilisin/kexin type 5-like [Polyodon spathula]